MIKIIVNTFLNEKHLFSCKHVVINQISLSFKSVYAVILLRSIASCGMC